MFEGEAYSRGGMIAYSSIVYIISSSTFLRDIECKIVLSKSRTNNNFLSCTILLRNLRACESRLWPETIRFWSKFYWSYWNKYLLKFRSFNVLMSVKQKRHIPFEIFSCLQTIFLYFKTTVSEFGYLLEKLIKYVIFPVCCIQ